MQCKRSIGRTTVQHPIRMASSLIREELRNLQLLGESSRPEAVAEYLQGDSMLGDLYEKHPVTLGALRDGFERQHIVPLSIYFDGVQYTKNDNFLGFYMTSLRTKQQRLLWLLRTSPT